jgi:hypothetical protein
MPDEVNWDNVQWSEPVKYNPAEGIPPAKPTSWADVANAVAPMVASGFLKPSQFPGLYQALGLPPAVEPDDLPKEQPCRTKSIGTTSSGVSR